MFLIEDIGSFYIFFHLLTPILRVNITSNVKLNASMQLECNHFVHICFLFKSIILYVLLIE